jgi:hypothetical protein
LKSVSVSKWFSSIKNEAGVLAYGMAMLFSKPCSN